MVAAGTSRRLFSNELSQVGIDDDGRSDGDGFGVGSASDVESMLATSAYNAASDNGSRNVLVCVVSTLLALILLGFACVAAISRICCCSALYEDARSTGFARYVSFGRSVVWCVSSTGTAFMFSKCVRSFVVVVVGVGATVLGGGLGMILRLVCLRVLRMP